MAQKLQILFISDDVLLTSIVSKFFKNSGHHIKAVNLEYVLKNNDSILLENMDVIISEIPEQIIISKELREILPKVVPVILISESINPMGKDYKKMFADDMFIYKPFDIEDLALMVNEICEKSSKSLKKIYQNNYLKLDEVNRKVEIEGRKVKVTRIEAKILKQLIKNAGSVTSRNEIVRATWGTLQSDLIITNTVNVHMGNLRKKIVVNGKSKILTVKKLGYILSD